MSLEAINRVAGVRREGGGLHTIWSARISPDQLRHSARNAVHDTPAKRLNAWENPENES